MRLGRPRAREAGHLEEHAAHHNMAVGRLWRDLELAADGHQRDMMSSSDARWITALEVGLLEEGVQRLAKAELRRDK